MVSNNNNSSRRLLLHEVYLESNVNLLKKLLSEHNVAEIKQIGEEFFQDFDPHEYDSLVAAFNLIYEIEYKYNMILNKEFKGMEQRKYNILEILEDVANNLMTELAKTFQEVFVTWLKFHAILNPRQWAEARVEESEEYDGDSEEIWNAFTNEYSRYSAFGQKMMNDAQKNLDKMPELSRIISLYSQDEKNTMYDDIEYEGYEEFGERYGKEFSSEEEARKFVDDYEPDPRDSYVWEDSESFEQLVKNSTGILTELYEHVLFPLWYGKWKEEGIDQTRETVEDAFKLIKKIPSLPFNKKFAALNHIINVNHQTGSMMDYYGEKYGVNEVFFEELSQQNTSKWDEELREIGVML